MICTDGFVTYERIAKDERIPHVALNGCRRTKRTRAQRHINDMNALISRFGTFKQPLCGPASKNLDAYGRWHAAPNKMNRSYLDGLRFWRDMRRSW